ncbi:MAG: uracil-DNA glycosylase [Gammaproteobacteria bacterium RIFCSPHIGHO2_12_FULL_41_20]|nr:MAG: uracil-DNA glycosylase [Gammaproteobacteria bacterium RIFCSPHIGHO2_12_FULL_41_20]
MKNTTLLPYLTAMGIDVFAPRQSTAATTAIIPPTLNWERLQQQAATCQRCSLHQTRTQTVFGVGNRQAALMIIGEAPGFYEDQQGMPFVGRAGQLLTAMLQAIGLAREDVYIANILKCRPPNNRDPLPEEVQSCTPFLEQQITLIQPKLLLAVGRIAAHYLLKQKSSLETLRGKIHYFSKSHTPLIVTFHPAYLLRNPQDKKKALIDLQFVHDTLQPIH